MECGNIPTSSTTANGVTHRCPELDVVAQKVFLFIASSVKN